MNDHAAALADMLVSAWPASDTRTLTEWSHDEVDLPPCYAVSGFFSAERVPFLRGPAEALLAPSVRVVVCQAAVQSLKTLLGELWLLHGIINDPGPTQWLQNTDEEAKEHAEERFQALLDGCAPVRRMLSSNRFDRKTSSVHFKHMFLRMEGVENIRNLQRKSIKRQMCSEVWQWPVGRLSEAEARLTQFTFNSKRYIESQPGTAGDDMDLAYQSGDRNLWHVACEACGFVQPMRWTAMRADGSRAGIIWSHEARRADGSWNLSVLEPSVRFSCFNCGHGHVDDVRTRRRLNASGRYVAANPDAPKQIRSFAWNQLTVENLSWFRQVQRWLDAMEQAGQGNEVPLREFMQKVLAEPYDPGLAGGQDKQATVSLSLDGDDPRWPGEKFRFLLVDVQEDHFWVLVEGWTDKGDSITWFFARLATWEDVAQTREKWKVPARCVFVDSRYRTREVYAECVARGEMVQSGDRQIWSVWRAMRGDDRREFFHGQRVAGGKFRRIIMPYSWPPGRGDPLLGREHAHSGKWCPTIMWSNPTVKDMVAARRDGRAKGTQTMIHESVDRSFTQHLYSERREKVLDRYNRTSWRWVRIGKRPNHGFDLRCMSVVAACIARVIGGSGERVEDSGAVAETAAE